MAMSRPQKHMSDEYAARLEAARARGMRGERRVITMLFCDVKGSTAMAEQLDPEEWAEIMNEVFDYLIPPVYRYEGVVARLMGDAILAFFGAPLAREDDPVRAILAGLDIIENIRPYRDKAKRRYGFEFDVRVGINTGLVVVGDIGSDLQMENTAMGDAINIAARMEQTADPGTMRIGADTYRLVAPLFDTEPLGEIDVKGKTQPVMAYRVLRRKAHPGRLRGIEGLTTPLIRREGEYDRLRAALGRAEAGQGQIAFLIGEAGPGKSRLISELQAAWADAGHDPHNWMETRCVAYDATRPYGLVRQLLYHTYGIGENEPLAQMRDRLADFAAQFRLCQVWMSSSRCWRRKKATGGRRWKARR